MGPARDFGLMALAYMRPNLHLPASPHHAALASQGFSLSEGALVEGQHEAGLDPVGRSERICCSPRKFLSSEKTRSHEAELGVKVKMIPVTPDSSRVVTAVLEVKGPDSFW